MYRYLILFLALFATDIYAAKKIDDCRDKCKYKCQAPKTEKLEAKNRLNSCTPSKYIVDNNEPEIFNPTNNLRARPGEKSNLEEEPLLIIGKVLDKKCTPISDVKIYLWQTSPDGKYPYTPLRNRVKKSIFNTCSCSSFTGSGVATTDNNGVFYFLTFRPKRNKGILNLRMEHKELGTLYTKYSFSNLKYTDPQEGRVLYGEPRRFCFGLTCVYDVEFITLVFPKSSYLTRY